MATKWADYCISAVSFNSGHTHIDKVKARKDLGEKLDAEIIYTRAEIVSAINAGNTFVTVVMSNGSLSIGQPVFVVTINGVKFIKTVRDNTTKDNLDNLPEF